MRFKVVAGEGRHMGQVCQHHLSSCATPLAATLHAVKMRQRRAESDLAN